MTATLTIPAAPIDQLLESVAESRARRCAIILGGTARRVSPGRYEITSGGRHVATYDFAEHDAARPDLLRALECAVAVAVRRVRGEG